MTKKIHSTYRKVRSTYRCSSTDNSTKTFPRRMVGDTRANVHYERAKKDNIIIHSSYIG